MFDPPADITENSKACFSQELFDPNLEAGGIWMAVFVAFICAYWILQLTGLIQQYEKHEDVEKCNDQYEGFSDLVKQLYPWDKVELSIKYNKDYFKFLIIRTLFFEVPFYILFFMGYGPAHIWNMWTGRFIAWGWCENGDGSWNL